MGIKLDNSQTIKWRTKKIIIIEKERGGGGGKTNIPIFETQKWIMIPKYFLENI